MKIFADAVVPRLFSEESVLILLPYILILLLLGVSIAVIRLVPRKHNTDVDRTTPTETTDSSEDDSCES